MRQALIILLVFDVIAAIGLVIKVESLIEGVEVTAYHLPQLLKELTKPGGHSTDGSQKAVDFQVSLILNARDEAQQTRLIVQLIALLLVVNAGFFWYVSRRWPMPTVSATELPRK